MKRNYFVGVKEVTENKICGGCIVVGEDGREFDMKEVEITASVGESNTIANVAVLTEMLKAANPGDTVTAIVGTGIHGHLANAIMLLKWVKNFEEMLAAAKAEDEKVSKKIPRKETLTDFLDAFEYGTVYGYFSKETDRKAAIADIATSRSKACAYFATMWFMPKSATTEVAGRVAKTASEFGKMYYTSNVKVFIEHPYDVAYKRITAAYDTRNKKLVSLTAKQCETFESGDYVFGGNVKYPIGVKTLYGFVGDTAKKGCLKLFVPADGTTLDAAIQQGAHNAATDESYKGKTLRVFKGRVLKNFYPFVERYVTVRNNENGNEEVMRFVEAVKSFVKGESRPIGWTALKTILEGIILRKIPSSILNREDELIKTASYDIVKVLGEGYFTFIEKLQNTFGKE